MCKDKFESLRVLETYPFIVLSASQHLDPANMAQSKRTCESAYEDGFMAAWAETDVGEITAHECTSPRWQLSLSLSSPRDLLFAAGWLRKTDAERILSMRSLRFDYVKEISQGDTDTESLTRVFFRA